MSKKPKPVTAEQMMDAAVQLHSATTGLILALARTLEAAGTIRVADFESNVRELAATTRQHRSEQVADLLVDFADQLNREVTSPEEMW